MTLSTRDARTIRLGIKAGRGESAIYVTGDYRSSELFHDAMERTEKRESTRRAKQMAAFRKMNALAARGDTPKYRAAFAEWERIALRKDKP